MLVSTTGTLVPSTGETALPADRTLAGAAAGSPIRHTPFTAPLMPHADPVATRVDPLPTAQLPVPSPVVLPPTNDKSDTKLNAQDSTTATASNGSAPGGMYCTPPPTHEAQNPAPPEPLYRAVAAMLTFGPQMISPALLTLPSERKITNRRMGESLAGDAAPSVAPYPPTMTPRPSYDKASGT